MNSTCRFCRYFQSNECRRFPPNNSTVKYDGAQWKIWGTYPTVLPETPSCGEYSPVDEKRLVWGNLSPVDQEMCRLLVLGNPVKSLPSALGITIHAVHSRIRRLRNRLGAESIYHLLSILTNAGDLPDMPEV